MSFMRLKTQLWRSENICWSVKSSRRRKCQDQMEVKFLSKQNAIKFRDFFASHARRNVETSIYSRRAYGVAVRVARGERIRKTRLPMNYSAVWIMLRKHVN